MSEQPIEQAAPDTAGGRQFTDDELAEARRQLEAQGQLAPAAGPEASGAELGMQALAAGAQAGEVDAAGLLREIRALQSQVDTLNRERHLAQAPEVVRYAEALRDHLAAKQAAHPHINADPDHSFRPVLAIAGKVVTAAGEAADSGRPGGIAGDVQQIERWVAAHARRFPHLDYSYIAELAGEVGGAAARLAA